MQEEPEQRADQRLSALADGELDAEATRLACQDWRDDGEARASWHAYHLIGDVLRSQAASDARHDERFLLRLRERLAAEPALLAPQALSRQSPAMAAARGPARWSWLAPTAVAAGFIAVASVLVVTRGVLPPTGGEGAVMAKSTPQNRTVIATAAAPREAVPRAPREAVPRVAGEGLVAPQTLMADDALMRDTRLDRYLAAHMEFGGSAALGAPSGFLRATTTRTPER